MQVRIKKNIWHKNIEITSVYATITQVRIKKYIIYSDRNTEMCNIYSL
jgi:hypothetical protein